MIPVRAASKMVVVLGMDRAGTSLCTNILHILGVELSEDLLPPHPDNPRGYFEARPIMEAQDRAFAALGFHWMDVSVLKPLPPAWWRLPVVRQAKAELSALVAAEIGKGHMVWGFKDPRTARLLPLWKDIFRELGVTPHYVLAVRHPRGVVQSMAKRDRLSSEHSELLWLERYTNALGYVGKDINAIVHYEDWFSRPLDQARHLIQELSLPWSGDEIDLAEAIQATVVPELRHDDDRHEAQFCLPMTEQLYQAMRSAPSVPDWKESLAEIAHQARKIFANSRAIVHVAQQQLEKQVADQKASLDERDAALAAQSARIAALTAALGEHNNALAAQNARIAALTAALGERDGQIARLLQTAEPAPTMAE